MNPMESVVARAIARRIVSDLRRAPHDWRMLAYGQGLTYGMDFGLSLDEASTEATLRAIAGRGSRPRPGLPIGAWVNRWTAGARLHGTLRADRFRGDENWTVVRGHDGREPPQQLRDLTLSAIDPGLSIALDAWGVRVEFGIAHPIELFAADGSRFDSCAVLGVWVPNDREGSVPEAFWVELERRLPGEWAGCRTPPAPG